MTDVCSPSAPPAPRHLRWPRPTPDWPLRRVAARAAFVNTARPRRVARMKLFSVGTVAGLAFSSMLVAAVACSSSSSTGNFSSDDSGGGSSNGGGIGRWLGRRRQRRRIVERLRQRRRQQLRRQQQQRGRERRCRVLHGKHPHRRVRQRVLQLHQQHVRIGRVDLQQPELHGVPERHSDVRHELLHLGVPGFRRRSRRESRRRRERLRQADDVLSAPVVQHFSDERLHLGGAERIGELVRERPLDGAKLRPL